MDLSKVISGVQVLAEVLGGVCVLATIIVRLTPTTKDDELVEKFDDGVFKFLNLLPTIGVNPNTQKLKDAYDEARAKLDAKDKEPVAS